MSEFKGTKRANEYCNSIDSLNPYKAYVDGYNQALEDSKSEEMLEMLEMHIYALDNGMLDFYKKYGFNISELSGKVRELIKQATEI